MGVGGGDGRPPVVVVEEVAKGSFELHIWVGEDCTAETEGK